ncbi:DoxX family protein [Ammoniphilus resinae]|uniref:Oxidoreductase n=1 Tax=Ammoniphilus resinae TaxID=861532 RepID=A0ABS4GLK8_9BACL|nr:DoxX family protein [Ammoniphilus resinae]MBP1931129.1 putative oxidoreductase [Ammoniphilus resinae]
MEQKAEWGLLFVRVVLAVIMLAHGVQKLFTMDQVVETFTQHLGLPAVIAYGTAMIEALAGLSLLLGFFVRISAFLFGLIMLGAIFMVKLDVGFFGNAQMRGYEFDLALLSICVLLMLTGSRKWSLGGENIKGRS